ncbi:MAG: YlmC/YmxH family sporulation protein [Bacillota bacterium]
MKNSELRLMDVIDIKRGKKLGYIDDVDIEVENGRIKAFVVPTNQNRLLNFFLKKNQLVINWNEIKKIGEDVILVELKEDTSLKNR